MHELSKPTNEAFCKPKDLLEVPDVSAVAVYCQPQMMDSSDSEEFEVIDRLEASLSPEEIAKVQAWLEPTEYDTPSSEYHRHLSSQAPGTGLWICETSQYQQWMHSDGHGSIWIKGVPGAGKSVIAASMIEHLGADGMTPVLYFFFRYIVAANRRPRSLVRDFLAQLLPHSVRLQATLLPLLSNPLDDFSEEILWEYLLTGLSSIEKAYCFIDALDEMELLPNDGFLDRVNSLATFSPHSVKLLMTSRPKQYLQSALKDASIVHISLEDNLVGKDIELFLSHRLDTLLPQDYQDDLRRKWVVAIAERSGGLFLYARLLLDQVIPNLGLPAPDVDSLVKDLPIGLEQMYTSMLYQQATIVRIDVQIQLLLLELATHSSRALRLNEMASVLASTFPSSMLPDAPKTIARSACAPLLEILEDETVSVIHHSFTEFLLNVERQPVIDGDTQREEFPSQFPVLEPERVHKKLSVMCMDYLRSGVLQHDKPDETSASVKTGTKTSEFNYQEAKLRHPFLEYAVGNWAYHASKYDVEDEDFFSSISSFMDPKSVDFKNWLELEWIKDPDGSKIKAPTPLHIAAFAGLTRYTKKLLGEGAEVEFRDAVDRTPLHWACSRGHTTMVALLLDCGATPNPEDTRGVRPIHEAARKNYAAVVKLLLEAGVDPFTAKEKENVSHVLRCGEVSTIGETAVEYAWIQGHTDTIITMLPFLGPKDVERLFCQCCRYGKLEAVRAMLKTTEVSVNSQIDGATALFLACRAKSVAIVGLLLEKGADVHQSSQWRVRNRNACGRKVHKEPMKLPVHGAVMGCNSAIHSENNLASQQILRCLLSTGADIEARDADGDTPLLSLFGHHSETDSDPIVASGLLQAGADVHAVGKNGDCVLHRCLKASQNIKMLKLLFQYGARSDVLSLSHEGDTVLHLVLKNFRKSKGECLADLVNLLLENGAQANLKSKSGITALEQAAQHSYCTLEIFEVMLQRCSDPEVLRRCLWKLHRMKVEETVEFVRVLQKLGVSLEDRDSEGRTALLNSISVLRSRNFPLALLECGADRHAVDARGRGVLHHYIANVPDDQPHIYIPKIEEMVNLGLDPLQVDNDGNSLLHVHAKVYKSHARDGKDDLIVQKLLDYGLSSNLKNKQGMTPLHVHLENWDANAWINSVNKRLEERFQERSELSLLKLFQKNREPVDINVQDVDGVTLLHLAAMRSETRMFYLLDLGADPSLLTKTKRNALHIACRAHQSNVVGYLCQNYQWMVNQQDEFGRTPLHDACTSGRPESVRLLLRAGADVTLVDNNKRTPLHACAEFAAEKIMWTLLSRPNEISGQVIRDRFRPASNLSSIYQPWYAQDRKRLSSNTKVEESPNIVLAVRALVERGVSIMDTDSQHLTALDLALEYDCPEMVRELQSFVPALREKMALQQENRRLETLVALKQSPISTLGTGSAAYEEIINNLSSYLPHLTLDDVELAAKEGGNINEIGGENSALISGESLLHVAASTGLTHLMLKLGPLARVNDDSKIVLERVQKQLTVDPNYRPKLETLAPALHMACVRELPNMDMVETLVEKCAVDVNSRAIGEPRRWAHVKDLVEGGTALHVIANTHHFWQLEALKYLIQKGADIEALNQKGETPLHVACTNTTYAAMNCEPDVYGYWRIESVKLLLEAGAMVDTLDNEGLSCLHKASSSPRIMRILLENGADVAAGKLSPIFPAIQIQCLETVTILLDAGVDPNIADPSADNEGFRLHYTLKNMNMTPFALLCASFSNLHNQRPKHSAPIVRVLIERGVNIYASINIKEKLVHYVFQHAEYPIVSAFLDCADRIDFSNRDTEGNSVFLAACQWDEILPGYRRDHRCDKAIAPFIRTLDFGADPLARDPSGRNALHHLLRNPEMEDDAIIQFLALDAASKLLYEKDDNGFTALNYALRSLRPAVVEVLCRMGADLLTPDPTGATALHRIAEQCIQYSVRLTRPYSTRERTPEFYAGALLLWKKYLALGGEINVCDKAGAPPLFSYLSSPQVDKYNLPEDHNCHLSNFSTYFAEEVVGSQLDFQARNGKGENALHVIAKREKRKPTRRKNDGDHEHEPSHDKELFRFFMGKGLDPLAEDGEGRSSLDVAAACEQKGILELFQYRK